MVEENNGRSDEITFADVKRGFLDSLQRNKGKLMVVLVVIGVFLLAGTVKLFNYSSTPGFCILFCHEMKPEYRTWKQSVHAKKDVECADCHMKKGLIGKLQAKWDAKGQMISHLFGTHLNNTLEKAEKEKVFLEIQNIHQQGDKRFYIKAVEHQVEIINKNCNRCHPKITEAGLVSEARGVRTAHNVHIDKLGFECTECHIDIVHGENVLKRNLPKMRTCFRCHKEKGTGTKLDQANCGNCHVAQDFMWAGKSIAGIEETPSSMFGDVECIDCHLEENRYRKPKSSAVCLECHDEDRVEIFHSWKNKLKVARLKLQERILTVEEKIAYAKKHKTRPEERASIEDAEKIFRDGKEYLMIVNRDGSNGIHNNEYALALIGLARKKVRESLRILP